MKNLFTINYLYLFAFIAVVSGCGGKSGGSENGLERPINVEVEQVKALGKHQEIAYSGTIEESISIPLTFSVIGTVSRVFVKEGERVKKGQLLAALNNESYKNGYAMAAATEKQAEDAYKRLEQMYKNGNLPEIKMVEVESKLQQARAAAAIAKKSLNDCNLHATVDGIIGKKSIEPGMNTAPGLAALTLVKIEKVFARVPISENEIAMIEKGQEAVITIPALGEEHYTGVVEEVGVIGDIFAHTYKIKIAISNKNGKIKPGMICNVSIPKKINEAMLVVPSQSIAVDESGKRYVYTADTTQKIAVKKYVQTSLLLREGIGIVAGLTEGEKVIVAGTQKLTDRSPIEIINQ